MVDRALRARRLRRDGDSGRDGEDSAGPSSGDAIDGRDRPEAEVETAELRDVVLRRLSRLDARERDIVSLRFGLDGNPPMTLKAIGLRLGVTREWVRKIEARAVRKLHDSPMSRS